jgi:hypothetical protein
VFRQLRVLPLPAPMLRRKHGQCEARGFLDVWRRLEDVERRSKTVRQKLDRLDEAFTYNQAIDHATYERQRDKLREQLTLTQIDRHASEVEELDMGGHTRLRRASAERFDSVGAGFDRPKAAPSAASFSRTAPASTENSWFEPA